MIFEQFSELSKHYNLIPVYRRFNADLHTALKIFFNLSGTGKYQFILESIEGIGQVARYSFLGKNPDKIIYNYGNKLTVKSDKDTITTKENIFNFIKNGFYDYKAPVIKELPYFTGGLVGYFGYESISLIEEKLAFDEVNELDIPDSIFGLYYDVVIYDHFKQEVIIISNVYLRDDESAEIQYNRAISKIDTLKDELFSSVSVNTKFEYDGAFEGVELKDNYKANVLKAKKDIYDGEVFQMVLSNRFSTKFSGDLINVYRALRTLNPSPYMYFLNFDDKVNIIGTSPEELISAKNKVASILPIAGTRKRGATEQEDIELENDLMNDPKELAEHTMLVDLARNDLGRVCTQGSVLVTENMQVHRYSHVMHIVSRVEGKLSENYNSVDAFKAAFPAGTVSGAPKIRAMELINKYENKRRDVYAGAVGYIDFNGNIDTCIAIRTMFAKNNKLFLQAGAGIVADSVPENEWNEVLNKSAVLKRAIELAGDYNENSSDR